MHNKLSGLMLLAAVLAGPAGVAEAAKGLARIEHIIVIYAANGGFWYHVPPPKGDRWGPGTRIPTIIISPFARKGFVDSTS